MVVAVAEMSDGIVLVATSVEVVVTLAACLEELS